ALPQPRVVGDDHRDAGQQAYGLAQVRVPVVLVRVGIYDAEGRNSRPEYRHGFRVAGEGANQVDEFSGEVLRSGDLFPQGPKLRLGGQLAVPQQVDDFLKGGLADKLADVVAAIDQPSPLAVDEANLGP